MAARLSEPRQRANLGSSPLSGRGAPREGLRVCSRDKLPVTVLWTGTGCAPSRPTAAGPSPGLQGELPEQPDRRRLQSPAPGRGHRHSRARGKPSGRVLLSPCAALCLIPPPSTPRLRQPQCCGRMTPTCLCLPKALLVSKSNFPASLRQNRNSHKTPARQAEAPSFTIPLFSHTLIQVSR